MAKTFSLSVELRSPDLDLQLNGRPSPFASKELSLVLNESVSCTDQLVAKGKYGPTELIRTYRHLGSRQVVTSPSATDSAKDNAELVGDLVGKSVRFVSGDDGKTWKKTILDSESPAGVRESVTENIDYRHFVPNEMVAEGESWSINPEEFCVLFSPGGNLFLNNVSSDMADRCLGLLVLQSISSNLAGQASGKAKRIVLHDGKPHVVIDVEARLTARGESQIAEGASLMFDSVQVVNGELLWDIDEHHARSADLKVDLEVHVVSLRNVKSVPEGIVSEVRQECTLRGRLTQTCRVENSVAGSGVR